MATYNVTITNGSGSQNLPSGQYNVTAAVTGYDNVTLDPSTFTATSGTGSESFTIAATGTLTLNVNDTGASGGTAITSGTFVRCSSDGNTVYGSEKTVSATGVCEFNNVPYGDELVPYEFYIKQLTSDSSHSIYAGVITIQMTATTQSEYVQNLPAAEQTFAFSDQYYSGLPISGSLTFDGPQ